MGIVHPLLRRGRRGHDVASLRRARPAEREPNRQACRLEPAVRGGSQPIHVADGHKFLRFHQQDPESRASQPGDPIGGATVCRQHTCDLGHDSVSDASTQPISHIVEMAQFGHHDGDGMPKAPHARRLFADRSIPRRRICESGRSQIGRVQRSWSRGSDRLSPP
jgi:hypothetical protein